MNDVCLEYELKGQLPKAKRDELWAKIKPFIYQIRMDTMDEFERRMVSNLPAFLKPNLKQGVGLALKVFGMARDNLKQKYQSNYREIT